MNFQWHWLFLTWMFLFGIGPALAAPADPPMSFKLVRLQDARCGDLCPAWISAEGRIVSSSASKLAKLLKDSKLRQLPVILTSGGGDIDGALAIGRLLHKYHIAVGIGRTVFDKCLSNCNKQKWQTGYVTAHQSFCFSACPLVLVGGSPRIVEPLSQIGLHQPTQTAQPYVDRYLETYRMVHGKKKIISRKFIKRTYLKAKTTFGLNKRLRKMLGSYLAEMKASPEILLEMEKAKPKDINIIRDDNALVRLGFETMRGLDLDSLVSANRCKGSQPPGYCVVKQ